MHEFFRKFFEQELFSEKFPEQEFTLTKFLDQEFNLNNLMSNNSFRKCSGSRNFLRGISCAQIHLQKFHEY